MKKIFFILYDGIQNSVFYSQVFIPLKKRLDADKNLSITLVSFERQHLPKKLIPKHERFSVLLLKKVPFFGRLTLLHAARLLTGILAQETFNCDDIVMARGPLAGWIVRRVFKKLCRKIRVIVQARGLAAEEFRFTMKRISGSGIKLFLKRLLQGFLYASYKKIERAVYGKQFENECAKIEIITVSPALKTYLETTFLADSKTVVVSYDDIPPKIDAEQVKSWRLCVRDELTIPFQSFVYCYMGSARAWQQVDEMVAFAAKTALREEKAFFLFLSAEELVFEKKMLAAGISRDRYRVLSVDPEDTYRYLSAADAGLVFRENDLVNWVARPTKMLEYQAVGLKIIHNNTVGWLSQG